jgi:hypothetical protein
MSNDPLFFQAYSALLSKVERIVSLSGQLVRNNTYSLFDFDLDVVMPTLLV